MRSRMKSAVAVAMVLASALMLPAVAAAQCEDWIQGPMDDGTLPNGSDGIIYDSITWDPDGAGPILERLVVAGNFTSIGGVAAQNVAQYDPSTALWSPLGSGIGPTVYCLAVFNGQVVAGCDGDNNEGTFDQTVRRWTGTAWEGLSATNTGNVYDMLVYNGELFIAGTFITQFVIPGSDPAHYIARWIPGSVKWEDVNQADFGSQTNTAVRAMAEYNGELYVAGWKVSGASITGSAIHITHGYPGGALFTTITDGTDPGGIYDLDVFAGELLIGGGFLEINGVTCNSFAGWNGSSFHAFQGGVGNPSGSSNIWSIVIHEGICIGGAFTTAGGTTVNRVAFWPPGGSAWQARGTGTDGTVYDLSSYRGELIAVGSFANAGVPANDIAHWNGTAWAPFGGGTANYVLAMTTFAGRLVAGGSFSQPTQSLGTASNIAGWNGGALSAFGTGMNNVVYALESFKYPGFNGSNELIAGGIFTTAGGVGALRIARWRENPISAIPPPAWEAMGAGFNFNVFAIERMGGTTYAGGNFSSSGGTALQRVARWNETTDVWENIGGMPSGEVYALKEYNGYLYAGGTFTSANGIATGGLGPLRRNQLVAGGRHLQRLGVRAGGLQRQPDHRRPVPRPARQPEHRALGRRQLLHPGLGRHELGGRALAQDERRPALRRRLLHRGGRRQLQQHRLVGRHQLARRLGRRQHRRRGAGHPLQRGARGRRVHQRAGRHHVLAALGPLHRDGRALDLAESRRRSRRT
jgi:hypothetical protein